MPLQNSGQVVGYHSGPGPATQAFLFSGSASTSIGNLGSSPTYPASINNSGQIVGSSNTDSGAEHAFLYSGGSMMDLTPAAPIGQRMFAVGISDGGLIAGNADFDAWVFEGATLQPIAAPGLFYSLYAVNVGPTGSVIGFGHGLFSGSDEERAFLYSGGAVIDLGTLGGDSSRGMSVNSSGQATGGAKPAGNPNYHAFLFSGGIMIDLGTLGGDYSWGMSINAAGSVVGMSRTASDPFLISAFVFTGGQMFDLNSLTLGLQSGEFLYEPVGINDSGQILVNGNRGLVLLTPVPEPATVSLLALGLTMAGFRRLRPRSKRP